jgi:hypothetical protein
LALAAAAIVVLASMFALDSSYNFLQMTFGGTTVGRLSLNREEA